MSNTIRPHHHGSTDCVVWIISTISVSISVARYHNRHARSGAFPLPRAPPPRNSRPDCSVDVEYRLCKTSPALQCMPSGRTGTAVVLQKTGQEMVMWDTKTDV